MRPLIIMLEDSIERVDWFKHTIIGVDLLVFEVVKDFVEAVKQHTPGGRLKLVIFDHDLGMRLPGNNSEDYSKTTDPDGLTGHDAAKMLDALPCASLVWSLNSMGSMNIQRELDSKNGVHNIYDAPFLSGNKKRIAETILSCAFPK